MRYIEPILYIAGDDEFFILSHAKQQFKKDYDILVWYEYQEKHMELRFKYIAPDYYKLCPVESTLEETLAKIEESLYKDYFKFFIVKFLLTHQKWSPHEFLRWVRIEHPIYVREQKIDVFRYYNLKRYYNTIVMDLNISDGNKWNRIWKFTPNLFNVVIVKEALSYLIEGGKLLFLNHEGKVSKIFDYTRDGYKQIKINEYIKEKTPKNEFKLPRKWL